MPTKHPRLNVVLDDSLFSILTGIAKKEDKSMSVLAKELIQAALEQHEDFLLSKLATEREEKSKKTIPHDKAW
jgi:predicted DNA-binding protein